MALIETRTMSAAVDDCISRSGRPDRRPDLVSFIRLSMRETQVLSMFARDLTEDEITTVTGDPYVWTIPDYFRLMDYVEYPHLTDSRGNIVKADYIPLGKRQRDRDFFYYGSGDAIVFVGQGLEATGYTVSINVAYYSYFRPLTYMASANRPARWLTNDETGTESWVYLPAYDVDATTRETARNLVTNWMLDRWYDVVLEGALAKLYKLVNDERASPAYALFKQLQNTILTSEARIAIGQAHE